MTALFIILAWFAVAVIVGVVLGVIIHRCGR